VLASTNGVRRPRRRPTENLAVTIPIDGRLRAGREANALKAALLRHLGPHPSQIQVAMVQQIVQLKLRLAMLDQRLIAAGGQFSMHDSHVYLAWSNSFVRALKALGLDSPPDAPPSLAEALAAGRAEAPGAAPADERHNSAHGPP